MIKLSLPLWFSLSLSLADGWHGLKGYGKGGGVLQPEVELCKMFLQHFPDNGTELEKCTGWSPRSSRCQETEKCEQSNNYWKRILLWLCNGFGQKNFRIMNRVYSTPSSPFSSHMYSPYKNLMHYLPYWFHNPCKYVIYLESKFLYTYLCVYVLVLKVFLTLVGDASLLFSSPFLPQQFLSIYQHLYLYIHLIFPHIYLQ